MPLTVSVVLEGSIADRKHIEAGDVLYSMNGNEVKDFIDFIYFEAQNKVTLEMKTCSGKQRTVKIVKSEYEHIGIAFEGDGIGNYQPCINKCLFCFIDQLPEGMRQSLYFKDDDWRLSFVMGNYVTLTNVPEREFERLLERHVSPLYISVHATDEYVRGCMLRQTHNGMINERLRRLKEAGIYFNCQAVICKGYNDGKVLDKTIEDLSKLIPYAQSLAIVPVGLTKHREGLPELEMIDKETAGEIIDIGEKWQKKLLKEHGTRFCFLADEFYIRAERPFPDYSTYEDFSQLEDGVGLIQLFMHDVDEALGEYGTEPKYHTYSVVTGKDAYPFIRQAADKCEKLYGITIHVYMIINNFFGDTITVTGLLTAGDILDQIKGKDLGECLLVTNTMLRDRKDTFLDDMTFEEFRNRIDTECIAIDPDGYSFVEAFSKEREA